MNLAKLLKLLTYFGKTESSIRTALSRMVAAGILKVSKNESCSFYQLTEIGIDNINSWNTALERFYTRYRMRNAGWDNNWQLLILSDFNKSEYENQFIIDEFRETGLREINNGWITCYDIDEKVLGLLEEMNIQYMIFSGSFSREKDQIALLKSTIDINRLKQQYADFIEKAIEYEKTIKSKNNSELLPILFDLGWNFYDIATNDPVLPLEIINHWEEDVAATNMRELRQKLFNRVKVLFE